MENDMPLIGFRVTQDIKARLMALAKAEHRSLAAYMGLTLPGVVEQLEQRAKKQTDRSKHKGATP